MTRLPNAPQAILDIRKIQDYCLNPAHPRGRHKARVFREAFGIGQNDAYWLRDLLVEGIRRYEAIEVARNAWGVSWRVDIPLARRKEWCGKINVDDPNRRKGAAVRDLLGAMMAGQDQTRDASPSVLDVVTLLTDVPAEQLGRGQVGTVVESLDESTVLVEFSDNEGRAYALVPCSNSELIVLHYVPHPA
jgi:Domain of unknown function (DUF4926)